MLMPGDDPAEMTRPERIWSLLERWVTPQDAVLERPAVYTFHSVVARGWRRGRLLIAGDAAHQTPPFLGQGMCAGIRDAANLAWKLAAVERGAAPVALLDSYESERSPHVREFIETAVRLGSVIQSTDAQAAARRDEAMAANPQAFATPQPRLGPGAYDSELPCAGSLAPQPVLDDGSRLDDCIGYRAALLVRPAAAQEAARLLGDPRCPAGSCQLVVAASAAVQAVLDDCRAEAVLLRPDRQVFGIASDRDAIAGLLRRAAALGVVPSPPLPGEAGPAG
jgi:3-(3-hydroxy-phenyl)propionate hydroxylase